MADPHLHRHAISGASAKLATSPATIAVGCERHRDGERDGGRIHRDAERDRCHGVGDLLADEYGSSQPRGDEHERDTSGGRNCSWGIATCGKR